jgi:hypothetical protein
MSISCTMLDVLLHPLNFLLCLTYWLILSTGHHFTGSIIEHDNNLSNIKSYEGNSLAKVRCLPTSSELCIGSSGFLDVW